MNGGDPDFRLYLPFKSNHWKIVVLVEEYEWMSGEDPVVCLYGGDPDFRLYSPFKSKGQLSIPHISSDFPKI